MAALLALGRVVSVWSGCSCGGLHRMVHERREGRGHDSWAVLDEQDREVVDYRTIIFVGHRRLFLGGVRHSQENLGGPGL